MDEDLQKQLIELWLIDLRLHTTHILKEYLEDDELLAWARKNIKQRVYESDPRVFEVYYQESELLFLADEISYHYHIKNYPTLQLN